MSKYSFERLGADRFEELVQALLEKPYRISGNLVQFGDGKDGAREATWTQPVDHLLYKRPTNAKHDVPKEWVFQAKYHDIGTRGWGGARADVESDLAKELDKIVNKYEVPCHKYILITNVPFSGVRHVGTRDKVDKVIKEWQKHIPEIEVWDAVDLSRMLDADPGTRTTYLDAVLPGDVLRAFLAKLAFGDDRRKSAFHAYLNSVLRSERDAKAEEAGDEAGFHLERIFVDLDLKLITESLRPLDMSTVPGVNDGQQRDDANRHIPKDLEKAPSSFAFLRADHKSMLLKGGPGVGKSTITQFLTLYHAARLVDPDLAIELARRLKLTGGVSAEHLDTHCRVRFPLRVELRRYAQWMADPNRGTDDTFLARYLAMRIGGASSADLTMDDVFALASENPLLLILDGLDEVPNPKQRSTIFDELDRFLDRCEGESCDVQIILSSRPQGYRGEFDRFSPIEWHVVDLDRADFEDYADHWLKERITNDDERKDARERIDDGMKAHAVQQMAKTLLQATVMLTIARRKHAIPHARHKLYAKYVEVIFERERNKRTVRERSEELLRLHELVGYKLIRKMESVEGDCTLGDEEFKQCVQQVIEDYGPSDLAEASIGDVVEEIVTLAKDRLCLLAGKGEDQQEVDFVIQPFREYFAAAYLAHHEDADPDRVYARLVERRHIWANVLQFYAAFQSKAQQKNWISEADGEDTNQETYEGIVAMTRKRRALLRVLPEFERPKNEYIKRAFRNLFAVSTRWTWMNRDNTAKLLDAFAPNESCNTLRQLFENLSDDDAATLHVELDLLAKSAGPESKSAVREILKRLCADERVQSVALEVAVSNDLQIEAPDCPVEVLGKALRFRPDHHDHRCPEFLKGLSEDQVLDLMISHHGSHIFWANRDDWQQPWLRSVWEFFLHNQPEFECSGLGGTLPAFVVDRRGVDSTEIRSRLKQTRSEVGAYLDSLLLAILNPTDSELFNRAKIHEDGIKTQLPSYLSVQYQLGPHPSDFSSIDEWAAVRNEVLSATDTVSDLWLSQLSSDDGSWVTLFIHPDAWPELLPIISEERLEHLMNHSHSIVKSLSPRSTIPIWIHSYEHDVSLDVFQLCNCVVDVVRKHGCQFVRNDSTVIDHLVNSDFDGITSSAADDLLRKTVNLKLPSFWAGLFVRVCSTAQGVDVARLLDFWHRHFSRDLLWIERFQTPHEDMISQALKIGTQEAISLAAFLASGGVHHHDKAIPSQLSERIVRSLCESIQSSSGEERYINVRLLLQQAPAACELAVWTKPENIPEGQWAVDQVARRFRKIANFRFGFDHEQLRKNFGVFVDKRTEYPVEIPLAAIDAIIRIDEIAATPLSDSDWQNESN